MLLLRARIKTKVVKWFRFYVNGVGSNFPDNMLCGFASILLWFFVLYFFIFVNKNFLYPHECMNGKKQAFWSFISCHFCITWDCRLCNFSLNWYFLEFEMIDITTSLAVNADSLWFHIFFTCWLQRCMTKDQVSFRLKNQFQTCEIVWNHLKL